MPGGGLVDVDSMRLQLRSCYHLKTEIFGYAVDTITEGPPISKYNALSTRKGEYKQGQNYSDQSTDRRNFDNAEPLFNSLANGETSKIFSSWLSYLIPIAHLVWLHVSRNADNSVQEPLTSNVTVNGTVYNLTQSILEGFEPRYCYNKKVTSSPDELAECIPEKYFVWGLSRTMVYIILSSQIVWIFCMYYVWLDAYIHSALCRSCRKVRGPFRAAADLVEAMTEVLGDKSCTYTNSELSRTLRTEPGIRYYSRDDEKRSSSQIGLSSRQINKVPKRSMKVYGERKKDQ